MISGGGEGQEGEVEMTSTALEGARQENIDLRSFEKATLRTISWHLQFKIFRTSLVMRSESKNESLISLCRKIGAKEEVKLTPNWRLCRNGEKSMKSTFLMTFCLEDELWSRVSFYLNVEGLMED